MRENRIAELSGPIRTNSRTQTRTTEQLPQPLHSCEAPLVAPSRGHHNNVVTQVASRTKPPVRRYAGAPPLDRLAYTAHPVQYMHDRTGSAA